HLPAKSEDAPSLVLGKLKGDDLLFHFLLNGLGDRLGNRLSHYRSPLVIRLRLITYIACRWQALWIFGVYHCRVFQVDEGVTNRQFDEPMPYRAASAAHRERPFTMPEIPPREKGLCALFVETSNEGDRADPPILFLRYTEKLLRVRRHLLLV